MFDLLFTSLESGPNKCLIWEDRAAGLCGGLKPISNTENVAGVDLVMLMSGLASTLTWLAMPCIVGYVSLQVNV